MAEARASRSWTGVTGRPPSGNGASSSHLFWDLPVGGDWRAVEVTLEVLEPPTVDRLYFWALQVSFVDGAGRSGGGAHTGLQWCTGPTAPAVNWGGYGPGGVELRGSESTLPSSWGNPNTRDYPWRPAVAYRLRVADAGPAPAGGPGARAWRATVTDLGTGSSTVVRDLWAVGDRLTGAMTWSEVFADCDGPSAAVRWSAPMLIDAEGRAEPLAAATVHHQALTDGGCATGDAWADDVGIVQRSAAPRRTPPGTRLSFPRPRSLGA